MTSVARPDVGERGWVSAHLFYQGSHDLLIRELVIPVLHDLRGRSELEGHFFLRHWQAGPHVRLRLRARQQDQGGELQRVLAAQAGRFFARWPSPDRLDDAGYARLAATLADREPGMDVATLAPNNTFQLVPYQPEHLKYGHGLALEAVERHFAQSSDLCLEIIRQDAPLAHRLMLAFGAVLAAAAPADLPDRDTLAARLNQSRRRWGRMLGLSTHRQERVSDAYGVRRARLRPLAQALCCPPQSKLGIAFLDGWRASMRALKTELAAFESELQDHGVDMALDHCAHLVCNRLGVEPHNEWFVRSLACEAVLDLGGAATGGGAQLPRQPR